MGIKNSSLIINEEEKVLEEIEILSKTGSWEIDLKTKEVFWSKGVYKMLGYEANEFDVDFEKAFATVHPDDQKRAVDLFEQVVTGNTMYEIQKKLISFDTNTKLNILYKLSLSYLHHSYNDEAKKILLTTIPEIKHSNDNEINGKLYKQLCYIGIIEYDIPSATKYYELSKKYFNRIQLILYYFGIKLIALSNQLSDQVNKLL